MFCVDSICLETRVRSFRLEVLGTVQPSRQTLLKKGGYKGGRTLSHKRQLGRSTNTVPIYRGKPFHRKFSRYFLLKTLNVQIKKLSPLNIPEFDPVVFNNKNVVQYVLDP